MLNKKSVDDINVKGNKSSGHCPATAEVCRG